MQIVILLSHFVYLGELAGVGCIEVKSRRRGIKDWRHVGNMEKVRATQHGPMRGPSDK